MTTNSSSKRRCFTLSTAAEFVSVEDAAGPTSSPAASEVDCLYLFSAGWFGAAASQLSPSEASAGDCGEGVDACRPPDVQTSSSAPHLPSDAPPGAILGHSVDTEHFSGRRGGSADAAPRCARKHAADDSAVVGGVGPGEATPATRMMMDEVGDDEDDIGPVADASSFLHSGAAMMDLMQLSRPLDPAAHPVDAFNLKDPPAASAMVSPARASSKTRGGLHDFTGGARPLVRVPKAVADFRALAIAELCA